MTRPNKPKKQPPSRNQLLIQAHKYRSDCYVLARYNRELKNQRNLLAFILIMIAATAITTGVYFYGI